MIHPPCPRGTHPPGAENIGHGLGTGLLRKMKFVIKLRMALQWVNLARGKRLALREALTYLGLNLTPPLGRNPLIFIESSCFPLIRFANQE